MWVALVAMLGAWVSGVVLGYFEALRRVTRAQHPTPGLAGGDRRRNTWIDLHRGGEGT